MLFSPVAHPSLRDSMDRATLPPPFFPSRPSILIRVSDHPPWLRTSPAVDGRGRLASAGGKWVGARGQRAPTEGTDGRLRGACVRARVLPPRRAPLLMPWRWRARRFPGRARRRRQRCLFGACERGGAVGVVTTLSRGGLGVRAGARVACVLDSERVWQSGVGKSVRGGRARMHARARHPFFLRPDGSRNVHGTAARSRQVYEQAKQQLERRDTGLGPDQESVRSSFPRTDRHDTRGDVPRLPTPPVRSPIR
jgi:hypothetical protein